MNRKNVEDLYPLSPLQHGMLFHTLYSPGTGAYLEQFGMTLLGEVDADAFRAAWQSVVDRHPVLRTGFVWEGVPQPLQVVFREVELPFFYEDWSGVTEAEREHRYQRELDRELRDGVDLVRAPLMRIRLFRMGAAEHRFVLTTHHMLLDGWSLPIVLGEFGATYGGMIQGTPASFPRRPAFREYITWLNRQDMGAAEAFWRARLAGIEAPTPLPLDRAPARAGSPAEQHATARVTLPPELVEKVEGAARKLRVTPNTLFQCAWARVLAAYTGEDDVVFGATVSGRPPELPGVDEMVGMFINAIPVRIHIPRNAVTAAEWVLAAHNAQAEARQYEHAPLARVRTWSAVPPEGPLFETLLVYENYPLDALQTGAGAAFETEPTPEAARREGFRIAAGHSDERTNYAISLVVAPSGEGFRIAATFDSSRLEPASVKTLLEGMERVLAQLAADPSVTPGALTPMPADEAERVVHVFNRTAVDYPRDASIPALFARMVAANPQAPAIVSDGGRTTYAELNAAANRLARRLRGLGVGAESRVGVSMERAPGLVVAVLAVLKAGGAYVPLDPVYPAERRALMARDSAVSLVIADADAGDWGDGVRVLSLADEAASIAALPDGDLDEVAGDAQNLAYVIYTSGSTGTPKGVAVPHRAVVRLVKGQGYARTGPGEVVLQFAPAAFDVSTFEFWGPLLNGGTVAVHPPTIPDPAQLGAFVSRHAVTTMWLTAGFFHQVMDAGAPGLSGVRELIAGGDALSAAHVERGMDALPYTQFVDGYGPTECTTFATCHRIRRADAESGVIPIGPPLNNTTAYVLDAGMRPVPVGAPAELYLGGDALARGYLGRPRLTAERFVPDPFGGGARLYRTGDRARWNARGELEFLGRADRQVKVRGYRIEPGEVEAALLAHPALRDVLVDARDDGLAGKRLVAYTVAAGDAAPDAAELRAHLLATLPEHMVPSAFVALEAMPLTPNGKVDRARLPDPSQGPSEAAYEPPSGLAEEALADIWREVLKAEKVGALDNFFHLGGHSLLAMQVASRVRTAFAVELPLRAIFDQPTLRDMAGEVEALLLADIEGLDAGDDAASPTPAAPDAAASASPAGDGIVPVSRTGDLPASLAQERLWFIDRMDPGNTGYNVGSALRLQGTLDVDALRRALGEVVRRHEALRTVFAEVEGRPVQRVQPAAAFALAVEDVSAGGPVEAERALGVRLAQEAETGFDLARGPLFRARLLRLGRGDHALLLMLHHVVSDGWSLGVLFREISALYHAFSRGLPSPLAELPVQYGDYAAWQRAPASVESTDRQLAWWRGELEGAPQVVELPADAPRPAVRTFNGARHGFTFRTEFVRALRELAQAESVTPFMVLLAAYQLLLARYAGVDDVLVGTPVAGRTRAETEGLIGFFANTVVLRARVARGESFRAFLAGVRDHVLSSFLHQDVPFERLVDELKAERSLARTPLYQAMFSLVGAGSGGSPMELDGLRVDGLGVPITAAKTDLSLTLHEGETAMGGTLEYSTDLFLPATAARMAEHYLALLASAVEDPGAAVVNLALMDGAEAGRVAALAVGPEVELPPSPVHRLFEQVAAERPDAPALLWDGGRSSYGELNARANRVARRLRELGVGQETRVGVAMQRSPELVAVLLAILKAGGAYVPLDPAYPAQRLAFMRGDAGISLVVVDGEVVDAGDSGDSEDGARVVSLAAEAERIAAQPGDDLSGEGDAGPDHLAYVMYTSGSTGTPKGVAVPHRAVVRLVRGQGYARFGADEVFLHLAPESFDASTFEIWGALLNGAALAVHPPHLPEPAELGEFAGRHGVTAAWLTAGLFHQVVDAGAPGLGGLGRLLAGGEALSPAHVERALALLPDTVVVNGYGPTEAVTFAACHVVPADFDGHGSVPIGLPLAGTQAWVLDEYMRLVPTGMPGDLYLGGDGLARGYLGRPAATAESFVPDPFSAQPSARLYRTGDRARWRPDGTLDFMGRADEQVKLRGYRIEPGEVEAVLRAHPAVRDAVVIVREDAPGARRLVAYVVLAQGEAVEADALRALAASRLPAHMVPAAFVAVDAIPLTPNGKVDRAALLAPETHGGGADRDLTPTEAVLASLWGELLGASEVGPEDGFFELGGHSLLAAQVVGRIRAMFAVELPLRALFEAPTLAGLAARVDAERRAGTGADDPIVRVPRDQALPVSFAQERMWFLQQLDPASALYNMPTPLRLRGALNVEALRRALEEIVRRHEPLRTVFARVDGQPLQRILPPATLDLEVTDLSHLAQEERGREALRLAGAEAAEPFDLEQGPLFRVSLLRLADDDHVLLWDVHHAVSDGWSVGVLTGELALLYQAFNAGRPSPLPELEVQYADFVAWQRRWLTDERVGKQVAYWKEQLSGAPPALELPTDRPRAAVQRHRGASARALLPPQLHQAVHRMAAAHGATMAMALLAGFQLVLARLAGQDDVVVGTPIAGRTRPETEPMIGLFLNTLAVRTRLPAGGTFADLLRGVRESMLGAYANQDVPFERLLEELQPERTLSRTPVFQVMFNMLNLEGSAVRTELSDEAAPVPGLRVENFGGGEMEHGSKFDLTLYAQELPRGVHLNAMYDADLFERPRMAGLLAQLAAVLEQAAANPGVRLDDLSLAVGDDAAALPDPALPLPAQWFGPVHEMVAARAAEQPDALAITGADGEWTYRRVDEASNRIARHLRESGVLTGDAVAVYAHRGAWLPVAMLGIARAGAAWVILDPAYPAARLEERLRIANPRALLRMDAAGALPAGLSQEVKGMSLATDLVLTSDAAHPDAGRLAAVSPDAVRVEVGPEDLAYLAFTSGTTGRAKMVAGTHRPLSHFFRWYADELGAGAGDRFTLLSGLGHDPLVRDVFAPLTAGAALAVPAERIGEPGWLAGWFGQQGITATHLTPAMGQLLASGDDVHLPALRLAAFGGDALRARDVERLRAIAPSAAVVNLYGATETPQAMSIHRVPVELDGTGRQPVGRGIDGVQLLVLTAGGRMAGVGELGEVAVRTPYLSRGYANDAELTAARFRANPFTGDGEDRVYFTGDLGRYRPDGAVELAGRADRQVQLRGFRVEPAEVEAAIAAHPAVREAAVVAREDGDGAPRLVAYVVTGARTDPAAELRAWVGGRLPDFMVPAAFVRLDALPLTANGKLDERALPDPEPAAEAVHVPPRTAAEQVLAEIWAEVLHVKRVGVEDNFFALGGHSLLATQVLSRVEQAFAVKLPMRLLFEHPTVAALAAAIEATGTGVLSEPMDELEGLSDDELAALLAEVEGAEGD